MSVSSLDSRPIHEHWRLRGEEGPLRAEPFSEQRLFQHARELAGMLVCVESGPGDRGFLDRFSKNAAYLRSSIHMIGEAERDRSAHRRDAEWLLDNFYIVEEQLREIQNDLPHRFYHQLPKTDSGEPRVYAIANELISHTDSVLDEENIVRFVCEFQTVAPLTMGEIWAVPIMLRLILIENLRRIAGQIISSYASELKASQLIEEWRDGADFPINLSPIHECSSLVFHVIEKLQQQGASYVERFRELERQLLVRDLTIQQSVHLEHQRQASSQVSIGNIITSMRLISAIDWIVFFDRTSLVEKILRRDPCGVYSRMDFESRDRYRHVIEELTEECSLSETEVSEIVVELAEESSDDSAPSDHIGYWLCDAGRRHLEVVLNVQMSLRSRLSRWFRDRPNLTYLGGISLVTVIVMMISATMLVRRGVSFNWIMIVTGLSILPASTLAIAIVNSLVTSWLRPRLLPKFDFSSGIPGEHRAVVVVPSLLSSQAEIDSLLQRLEMHYLANPDPALCFALLTDFHDAPNVVMPTDAGLLQQACAGIQALNAKHAGGGASPFFLFHRRRQWNQKEGVWMGWERKRGKLIEFNRFLLRQGDVNYLVQEGQCQRLFANGEQRECRYVITLDSDTILPHGVAQKLVATMSHPLNAPICEAKTDRIRSGYVVLQPRVTVNLTSAQKSHFAKIFANNPGIDPYSTSASDVYQDLYGEGSFTGKGIYEIAAFDRSHADAFPENQILSHDLIEGCHARVGFVSDIELFDNYPPTYEADARRQHRWVRGDWQISAWLFPIVPTARGWRANRLSWVSRWKIFDNLRRSLEAPGLMVFLVVGWLALPDLGWYFTTIGLLVQSVPMIATLQSVLRSGTDNVSLSYRLRGLGTDLSRYLTQTFVIVGVLPHKSWLMVDAIVRTVFRMLATRRKMLEWQTASEVERRMAAISKSTLKRWSIFPVLTILLACFMERPALAYAGPFLFAWLASPLLVYWLGLPPKAQERSSLNFGERQRLRIEARRIWAFFEIYANLKGNCLPPDNVQEYPEEKIAPRISPTNEGLFLVSGLVARDFGYVSLHKLVGVWERNLAQWMQFDRLNGHFYNWYDTEKLEPLFPRYVSTVDSGNLVACCLTLQRGIEELRNSPVPDNLLVEGLTDTIEMIAQTGNRLGLGDDRRIQAHWHQLVECMNQLKSCESDATSTPLEWHSCVKRWLMQRTEVASRLESFATTLHGAHRELVLQIRLLLEWLEDIAHEDSMLCPWLPVIREGLVAGDLEMQRPISRLQWNSDSYQIDEMWLKLWENIASSRTLAEIGRLSVRSAPALEDLRNGLAEGANSTDASTWVRKLETAIHDGSAAASQLEKRLQSLSNQIEDLVQATDFRILYNPQRKLLSIGFNLEEGQLDKSHYDLLCSEARIASFLAIAKGDIEARHWFRLGRQLTQTAGQLSLLSWGGTMFEYLMPHLFQNNYEDSLLAHSCSAAVARQQEYGQQRGVPWGISECGFGALAANSDYHYRSFGVPGLGLKRGLSKDLVISPYSTMLAIEFDSRAALANLTQIEREKGNGTWGFYESIDFTSERVPAGKRSIVVQCYMTHHHGMSLLALSNLLNRSNIRNRFHDHAMVRTTELLLQERVPEVMPKLDAQVDEIVNVSSQQVEDEMVSRRIVGVGAAAPRIQLLSNGQYNLMISSTGGGYSQCNGRFVTRWRSDPTRDHWGHFIYLSDGKSGEVWSATYQPICTEPSRYEVIYSVDKAEFLRQQGDLETHLEVIVSPENNAEIRQLKIVNNGNTTRDIEVTSYGEICLIDLPSDIAHCSFQKLFVETEYVAEKTAILAKRRPRDSRTPEVWAMHSLSAESDIISTVQFETSRQQFLGRGRTTQKPLAVEPGMNLTGTTGAVLDPIFSLRCQVTVPPHGSVSMAFTTSVVASRDEALALADQYHDPRGVQRAFELAWAYSQVELRHLHLSPAKMHLYNQLASAMLYPDPCRRPTDDRLKKNLQSQRGLWRYGISGDRPIFLIHVTKPEHIGLVREALGAHSHWKAHDLRTELVVVNDFPGSYLDAIQEQLVDLFQDFQIRLDDKPAEVFLLRGAQIPNEDKILLDAVASIVLHGERGSLARQMEVKNVLRPALPSIPQSHFASQSKTAGRVFPSQPLNATRGERFLSQRVRFGALATKDLEFWNGFGGFADSGREYHIRLSQGRTTPMPWSNVIANPQFGCLLTESGGGFTWFGNSRENKITNWANDPICDPPAEALYIYDCDSGELTSPFSGVTRDSGEYWVQHGQGYTRFIHHSLQLAQEVFISIADDDPVKFIVLTLRNQGQQQRHLSVTYFVEWVLGVTRDDTQMHVSTSFDERAGALFASNHYQSDNPNQVAFLSVLGERRSVCGDRTEFFGRNGHFDSPAALNRSQLSGRTGAGFDPCGAMQSSILLAAGEEVEVVFLLGAAGTESEARQLLDRYKTPDQIRRSIVSGVRRWNEVLEAIEIKTPNRAFDLLVNRWLLYQTLSCRVWGRSAYYQSGGAFGFRDQLQDVMALVYSRPDLARNHIVIAASRQFQEGDVQHWWHPPQGRGTRTRFSDDKLWLPFVVCHYVAVTNDETILNETASFLYSPPLDEHQQERFELPTESAERVSIYEHCQRSISNGFQLGEHGLPIMGCGDWNDGMNMVGAQGKGESVWVGWFLLVILDRFIPIMERRGDVQHVEEMRTRAARLRRAMEDEAWDGEWYRRAFFDDGMPLGSAQNDECQIDSITQTWAVIAGADPKRSREAVESVLNNLVDWKNRVVLLFSPPFNDSSLEPGYIKGYVPGIRENGGQYTHAVAWLIQALAILKENDTALKIFDLINPIHHSSTRLAVLQYQVEPYVIAADVYSASQYPGRGGWTWYTGSAAWLYRVAIESILGFQLQGNSVRFLPRIPSAWNGFELKYRRGPNTWTFRIVREESSMPQELGNNGRLSRQTLGETFSLTEDMCSHEVVITLPRERVQTSAEASKFSLNPRQ